jgi:hypothetical protein
VRGLRTRLLIALVAIVATTGILGVNVPPPQATAQAGLFSDAPGRAPAPNVVPDSPVVRTRYVDVNFGLIDGTPRAAGSRGGAGETLTLNLFPFESAQSPGVTLTAIRDRVEPSSSGRGYIWIGHVQGLDPALGAVTLVVENGVMVGGIRALGGTYQVRSVGNGLHAIYQVDEYAYPPDQHLYPAPVESSRAAAAAGVSPAAATRSASSSRATSASTLSVLVVYTPGAATGGGITNLIDQAIVEANATYTNSQIPQTLVLAAPPQQVTYTSSGDLQADLRCVAGTIVSGSGDVVDPNASCLANVRQLRAQTGADLVALWVEGNAAPGTTCGIGYVNTNINRNFGLFGYSVVQRSCAVSPSFAFTHELGHNMGANHDRLEDAGKPALFPFSYDYVDPGFFRTIMAYPNVTCNVPGGCPIIQHFSNPGVFVNGRPTGVQQGQPTAADNHQTLINTGPYVENYACVVTFCANSNDTFFSAAPISSFPTTSNVSTLQATLEAGEGSNGYSCGGGAPTFDLGKTVWYAHTPTTSGQITVSTAGSNFDTAMALFSGTVLGSLQLLACNDNASGGGTHSQITFNGVAGTPYRIQVGGKVVSGTPASGNLVVNFTGPAGPTATPTRTPTPTPPPNATATPTRTPTPNIPATPVASCNPRPPVNVSTQTGSGQLSVTISASSGARIQQLQFGTASNALINVPVAGITNMTGNQTVNLPPETLSVPFTVRRQTAGVATHVNLTVVDQCGSWPTFVGGGSGAGF